MNKLPFAEKLDEGITSGSPSRKSLSFILKEDYIPPSGSKDRIDQS